MSRKEVRDVHVPVTRKWQAAAGAEKPEEGMSGPPTSALSPATQEGTRKEPRVTLYIASTHPDHRRKAGAHRRATAWDRIWDRLRAAMVPEILDRP